MQPDKTVWITGASSGIGRQLALDYLAAGTTVIASARSEAKLSTLAAEADLQSGAASVLDTTSQALSNDSDNTAATPAAAPRLLIAPIDVTDNAAVMALVESLAAAEMLPDIAILNAGYYEPVELSELTLEHFETTVDVNFRGVYRCMLALLPHYRSSSHGHIVIMSSVAGYSGLPRAAAYGATKAALTHMAESLKAEFTTAGLDLTVVNPGFVETPLTNKNRFQMPFIVSPQQASNKIIRGIEKKKFEVFFPWQFALILKFLRLLPYPLYLFIQKRLL